MTSIGKALFSIFLVLIAATFIIYHSDAHVIDTNKETYQEAIQSASQLATAGLIDTSAVNNLYDGVRTEDADLPINYDTLETFRSNLSRLLESKRGNALGNVSNINIPMVGFVTYDYILGVTYGDEYKTSSALAKLQDSIKSEDYLNKSLYEQYNLTMDNRGTYLIPMGYTYYSESVNGASNLSNKVWYFTLGDIIYVTDPANAKLNDKDTTKIDVNKQTYVVYSDDSIGSNGCTLVKLDSITKSIIDTDKDGKPDSDTIFDISSYIRSIGFNKISELKEWVLMTSINEYLTMYSGSSFNRTSDNTGRGLEFSLSASKYSADKNDFVSNSSVITGPGMFAIVDLYSGSGSNQRLFDRVASFGGSELVKRTSTSINTTHGNPDGTGPGGGEVDPDNPSKPPVGPTDPEQAIIKLSYSPGLHGSGTTATQSLISLKGKPVTFQISKSTFSPDLNFKFKCWNSKADGTGDTYYPGQVIDLTADLKLYAIWEDVRDIYYIRYYSDGILVGTESCRDGDELYVNFTPIKDGSKLYGWSDAEGNKVIKFNIGQKLIMTQDYELHAVWDTDAELLVTASDEEFIYDGKSHNVTVECNDINATIKIIYKDAEGKQLLNPTDVGEYTVEIEAKSGFREARSKAKIVIQPKELSIVTGSDSKRYDGTPLTNSEATINGLVDGERLDILVTGSQLEVGTSPNYYLLDWVTAKENNYTIIEKIGKLEVLPQLQYVDITINVQIKGLSTEELNQVKSKIALSTYDDPFDSGDGENEFEKNYSISDATIHENTITWVIQTRYNHLLDVMPTNTSLDGKEVSFSIERTQSILADGTKSVNYVLTYENIKKPDIVPYLINYDTGAYEVGEKARLYICIDNKADREINAVINLDSIRDPGLRIDKATIVNSEHLSSDIAELTISGNNINVTIPNRNANKNIYEIIIRLDITVQSVNEMLLNYSITADGMTSTSSNTWINALDDVETVPGV